MNTSDSSRQLIRQACVIPFRRTGDRLDFCLITSLKKKRWIYPKGIVDPGETVRETALKEAFEEAGLRGQIVGAPLGEYHDAKWGANLHVIVLMMEVTACDDRWHEADIRQRRWVTPDEAIALVSKRKLRQFTIAAVDQLRTEA